MATPLTREQWLTTLGDMVDRAVAGADAARREKFLKALSAFETAHADFLYLGAIPLVGVDHEEQKLIDAERTRIKRAYTFRRNRLVDLALWG